MRFIKGALTWAGHGTTLWGLLPTPWQAGIVTALGAVTAYFGYQAGGLAWAIVLTTAVFAFVMMGIYFALGIASRVSVFQRISISKLAISDIRVTGDNPDNYKIEVINLIATVKNDSQRLVFYRIRREF